MRTQKTLVKWTLNNQRARFDSFAKELGIKEWQDWYKISTRSLKYNVVWRNIHRGSLSVALRNVYPEHPWQIFDFLQVPAGYWDDFECQKKYWNILEHRLGIKNAEDWYNVSIVNIQQHGCWGLLHTKYKGSLKLALRALKPEHDWNFDRFKSNIKAQSLVFEIVQRLVPNGVDIFQNYACTFPGSPKSALLDIFVPSWKLAIEYQGHQHYETDHRMFLSGRRSREEIDDEKRKLLKQGDITLLEIPFWEQLELKCE
eukprot:TRINITY_DN13075_c0_g1_i1.p1 TRINITY_DN13075_c0_g1~~TRINITY_DN13075_c0_g1_i1.p1  ORF type:complete len:257 (+),score=47.93 TRINITY_DN13075_c0_g1_i1:158-928(+)